MFGILLIDKPLGITSHDVVNAVRRRLGTRRVGHAGTLDPLATGLLVVAVGPATRFLQYLPIEPKEYVGRIRFGQTTDSYDAEGAIVEEKPVPDDLSAQVKEQLPGFHGLIEQLPPMLSAIKVQGKPLYQYARQGQEMKREFRTVHVDQFEVLGYEGPEAEVRVVCSGGTYVRSLAHDLGQAVGCGAYLSGLRRTRVGRFSLDGAIPLEETAGDRIIPLAEALPPMQLIQLDEVQAAHIREGRAVSTPHPPLGRLAGLLDPQGRVFSVARVQGQTLQPECVVPREALDGTL
jgi:tRNA pseudouridine55 synthase